MGKETSISIFPSRTFRANSSNPRMQRAPEPEIPYEAPEGEQAVGFFRDVIPTNEVGERGWS